MSRDSERNPKARTDWQKVPTVFVVVPWCPTCYCLKYDKVRTCDNGDGTATKLCICRGCGKPYKIVPEFPESGNDVIWED